MILAQQTRLMILDEPSTYMDMSCEKQFMDTLSNIRKTMHKTVVAVMHDLNTAVRYAQRIIVMDGGSVVFEGTTEECLGKQVIEQTFGVKRHTSDGEVFFY